MDYESIKKTWAELEEPPSEKWMIDAITVLLMEIAKLNTPQLGLVSYEEKGGK